MSTMNQYENFNHGWLTSIKKLLPMINIIHNHHPSQNLDKFHNLVKAMLINHGEGYTIERLKSFRLVLQQTVLKQDVTPIPFCKTDKDGFPKAICFLKPAVDNTDKARYSLSVIRLMEEFRCKPKYSVDTITESSKADKCLLMEISEFMQSCSVVKLLKPLGNSRLITSNKAGPNGPASISATKDFNALQHQDPKLLRSILSMLEITCPDMIINDQFYESQPNKGFKTSKLVLLSDKACKTRVIAIADWWSNFALEALHRAFMKALSNTPGDVTYCQSKVPDLIKRLGPNLFSSDMTAFTDRFPIELEVNLVKAAYGAKISELWKQVISERTFYHRNGSVVYNCGNPMGILSSWPISTLTHHIVKLWCAKQVGVSNYKYLILGDDTLDTNKLVYQKYIDTIDRLGVSVSLAKCTSSESGFTEFAKRLFSLNGELTGLPVHLLSGVRNNPEQFLELVRICRERGYKDSFLGPSLVLLLSTHNKGKMVIDMLSLPENVTGMPPLLEVKPGTWAHKCELLGESLEDVLLIARNYVFWSTAGFGNTGTMTKEVNQGPVEEYHPLISALSGKAMKYLDHENGQDEYSIYNAWMKGNYREMANLPNVDTYRYYNKGHKATKCKYDVLHALLDLSGGNCNIPLHKPTKLSNFELFSLCFDVQLKD